LFRPLVPPPRLVKANKTRLTSRTTDKRAPHHSQTPITDTFASSSSLTEQIWFHVQKRLSDGLTPLSMELAHLLTNPNTPILSAEDRLKAIDTLLTLLSAPHIARLHFEPGQVNTQHNLIQVTRSYSKTRAIHFAVSRQTCTFVGHLALLFSDNFRFVRNVHWLVVKRRLG
jgi:hypothetical protein